MTDHADIDHSGLTGVGGAYDEGTSFPGAPTTGDKFFHNTYDMLFYYDGTRWLCTCPHQIYVRDVQDASSTGALGGRVWPEGTDDLWMVKASIGTSVITTNSGAAYWTVVVDKVSTTGTLTQIATANTSAHSANNAYVQDVAIGAVLDVSAEPLLLTLHNKTGSPGTLRSSTVIHYRIIGV